MKPCQLAVIATIPLLLNSCGTNPAAVEGRIRELEQQLVKAALTGDGATLERLFSPQFSLINPSGAVASRQELLTMLSSGPSPYRSGSYVTETVHPYGKGVVSTGIETVIPAQGAQAGKQQQRRITQVWERAGKGWQLLLRQATLVVPPP
jgi:Domain of unknown function (DUF4440)